MAFLAVPLKTTSDVDLVKPLTTYIESVYNTNEDNRAEVSEAVLELHRLRAKAVCSPMDKHQSALDVLTRYYDQLVAIENKIIISATQNPVVFKWKDAFDKGGIFFNKASLSLSDGAFERASVLFNCGALMSQIAGAQPLKLDEDIRAAALLYRRAAGVFEQLAQRILGMLQEDPTPDLMPDTLSALSALMVAQAQEVMYIKAYTDKMKASALVKIGAQANDFYDQAYKAMCRDTVKGLWEKEWLNTVTGKMLAYQALAQYHQAQVCEDEKKVGEQIARLTEAQRLSQQATKYLGGALDEQMALIPKALTAAKKDNDFIYHERVPEFRTLPPLQGHILAKPTPVEHPMSPRFKDMFASLVPVQVHNAMQVYETRRGELLSMENGRMREHTQLMNGVLASLNLPAALDDVASSDTLPESIRQKSAKVKQAGGIDDLNRLFAELPALYKRNQEILDETERALKEEKDNDNNLRSQFGAKWTRTSSEHLTGPLIQEIGKYRGILHTATNADQMVKKKFQDNQAGIALLSKNEPELKASIPGQASHGTGSSSEAVTNLRRLMQEVQEIKVERERLEKELKSVTCDIANDFLQALSDSQLLNEEQISREKLQQIYGPIREKIAASLQRQDQIMEQVQTWNNKFMGEKQGSAAGAERERVLKTLACGHDAFIELKSNLEEGTKFYNDLTPILVKMQSKINDFVFARKTEKEDLMKQVQQNIIGGGGGASSGSGAAPPPRPPPPRSAASRNPFEDDVESPIPPPRNIAPNHAAPTPTAPASQPMAAPVAAPQMPPYYNHAVPYGQPQPMMYNYGMPYPTYPGAYGAPMYSGYPPPPQGAQQPYPQQQYHQPPQQQPPPQ
ncbi:unnamed protein product, partial [Mesorhabditis spiculigera]